MSENASDVEVSPLAKAEDDVNQLSRAVSQAFKAFIKLPNLPNTQAVIDAMSDDQLRSVLSAYRKAYAEKHFS